MSVYNLKNAAFDFRYLLNKGYPRQNALNLVGDRYQLYEYERKLLHRGVFSVNQAGKRKSKQISLSRLKGCVIGIDGHNVLITLESALKKRPLVFADDGFVRDIAGISHKYRITKLTLKSLNLIFRLLKKSGIKRSDFYFDAPLSKSGELARLVRDLLKQTQIEGGALAVLVPERKLMPYKLVATSDSALVDSVKGAFDLAGYIIKRRLERKHLKIFNFNLEK